MDVWLLRTRGFISLGMDGHSLIEQTGGMGLVCMLEKMEWNKNNLLRKGKIRPTRQYQHKRKWMCGC
jgi:hypothetical protein